MVSICIITYNHEKTIARCLDSVLSQEFNFNIEILIHDDCSTDGTIRILREYEQKHEGIIRLLLQPRNVWSQGIRGIQLKYNFSRATYKYLALCEGDDYWVDKKKLAKQVEILEANENISMVCSSSIRLNVKDGGEKLYTPCNIKESCTLPQGDVIAGGGGVIDSATFCFRSEYFHSDSLPKWLLYMPMDLTMMLYMVDKGEVYCLYEPTAVYRMYQDYSWTTDFNKSPIKRIKHHWKLIIMWLMYILRNDRSRAFNALNNIKHSITAIIKNILLVIFKG